MSSKVYEFINFIASDGHPASIMAPSPQFAEMKTRALRAEAEVRALREAQGELLDLLSSWVPFYSAQWRPGEWS